MSIVNRIFRFGLAFCLVSWLVLPSIRAQAQDIAIATVDTGQLAGIPEKVLTEAYGRLGLSVSFTEFSLNKSLEVANAGDYDGETGRVAGVESKYPNLLMVPVSFYSLDAVALATRKDIQVDGWESLAGYRVGYIAGGQLVERETKGWERVTTVQGMSQGLKLLLKGKFDVFIDERRHASREIAFFGVDSVKILEPPIVEIPLYHYVHKKNAKLIPRLTKVLQDMEAEGVIDKIAAGKAE